MSETITGTIMRRLLVTKKFNRVGGKIYDVEFGIDTNTYPGNRVSQQMQAIGEMETYELFTKEMLYFTNLVRQNGGKTRVAFLKHGFNMTSPLDLFGGFEQQIQAHRKDGNTLHGDELMVMFNMLNFVQVWGQEDMKTAGEILKFYFGDVNVGLQEDDEMNTVLISKGTSEIVPRWMKKRLATISSYYIKESILYEANKLDHSFIHDMVHGIEEEEVTCDTNEELARWQIAFSQWETSYDSWKSEL